MTRFCLSQAFAPRRLDRLRAHTTATAIHEAAHAVLHIALALGLKELTIKPDYEEMTAGASTHGGEWGSPATDFGEEDDETAQLRVLAEESFWLRHAIACYAGAEAVKQLCPEETDPTAGAESDFRDARDAIYRITEDAESFSLLHALAERRSALLVEYYRPEILAIAHALKSGETLSGEAVRKLFFDSLGNRRGGLMSF